MRGYAFEIFAFVSVIALCFLALWMIWNEYNFLFMVPLGLAILITEGMGGGSGGDCDPCMGG